MSAERDDEQAELRWERIALVATLICAGLGYLILIAILAGQRDRGHVPASTVDGGASFAPPACEWRCVAPSAERSAASASGE